MLRKMALVYKPRLAKKVGGMAACGGRSAGPEHWGVLGTCAAHLAVDPVLPSAQPLALRLSCLGEGQPP